MQTILDELLDALDLQATAADMRTLAELIRSGEWRNQRQETAALGFCVLGCLSLKAASLLGHDPDQHVASSSPDFEAASLELATACGYQPEQVAQGPLLNAFLMAMLQEIIRRLPDLIDLLDRDEA
jgi:hypothetical protein